MKKREKVPLRILTMPCCDKAIAWICEDIPDYCPRCGAIVFHRLLINGVAPRPYKAVLEVRDE